MQPQHILLSGERGAGKSTLIRRLLAEAGLTAYGFVTAKTEADESGLCPVHIHPAGLPAPERVKASENLVGTCADSVRAVYPAAFDALGVQYIEEARPGGVIVMDELGFMEAGAEAFKAAVLRALGGSIPVLAAVKSRQDVPFLNAVRGCPHAVLHTVTPENREALFQELLPRVRAWKDMRFEEEGKSGMRIALTEPTELLEAAAMEYRQEYIDQNESWVNGSNGFMLYPQYDAWLSAVRQRHDAGTSGAEAPATTFFSIRESDGRIIGTIQLRHCLTPDLEHGAGQIGYGIRPSERGKGYATEQLLLVLDVARQMKLPRVMLACEKGNIASNKTAIRCGGVLSGENTHKGKLHNVYWIDLR